MKINEKEFKKIKNLKKQLDEMNVEDIVGGEVKRFGTSAHLNMSKKYLGKKTITLILKQKEKRKFGNGN